MASAMTKESPRIRIAYLKNLGIDLHSTTPLNGEIKLKPGRVRT